MGTAQSTSLLIYSYKENYMQKSIHEKSLHYIDYVLLKSFFLSWEISNTHTNKEDSMMSPAHRVHFNGTQ